MSTPQRIGERISYQEHDTSLTVVITQEIKKTQRFAMEAWGIAWIAVGVAFAVFYRTAPAGDGMYYAICLAFWAFFLFRVGKTILWRRIGREMIRVSADGISVKNAFGTRGRARHFLLANIKGLEVIPLDSTGFISMLDQSFWLIGGDRLQFTYLRQSVRFGKQLSDKESQKLAQVLDRAIRRLQSNG